MTHRPARLSSLMHLYTLICSECLIIGTVNRGLNCWSHTRPIRMVLQAICFFWQMLRNHRCFWQSLGFSAAVKGQKFKSTWRPRIFLAHTVSSDGNLEATVTDDALRLMVAVERIMLSVRWLVRRGLPGNCLLWKHDICLYPVSYTHLTLPTIYSV